VPVWQSLRPWVKVEVLNALNNQTLVSWNTSITADASGPKDENGLPVNYVKSAAFGSATAPASYPRPRPGLDGGRTMVVAAGVRFRSLPFKGQGTRDKERSKAGIATAIAEGQCRE
jgi:hypothetical protein